MGCTRPQDHARIPHGGGLGGRPLCERCTLRRCFVLILFVAEQSTWSWVCLCLAKRLGTRTRAKMSSTKKLFRHFRRRSRTKQGHHYCSTSTFACSRSLCLELPHKPLFSEQPTLLLCMHRAAPGPHIFIMLLQRPTSTSGSAGHVLLLQSKRARVTYRICSVDFFPPKPSVRKVSSSLEGLVSLPLDALPIDASLDSHGTHTSSRRRCSIPALY